MSSKGEKGVGEQDRVVLVISAGPCTVRTRQTRAARDDPCLTDAVLAHSAAARAILVRSWWRGGSPRGRFPESEVIKGSNQPLVGRRASSLGNFRVSVVAAIVRRVIPAELPSPSAIPKPPPMRLTFTQSMRTPLMHSSKCIRGSKVESATALPFPRAPAINVSTPNVNSEDTCRVLGVALRYSGMGVDTGWRGRRCRARWCPN